MKVRYLKNRKKNRPLVLAIGVFDGIHKGHLKILNKTKEIAKNLRLDAGVLTFSPHPLEVLTDKKGPALIISLEERLKILKEIGMDRAIIVKFSKEFSEKNPYDFIKEVIIGKLNARCVVVGSDYRFGEAGGGDKKLLEALSEKVKFKAVFVKPLTAKKHKISSSLIRKLISGSRFIEASKYLGRYYFLCGKVVKGSSRGKILGFATANLAIPSRLLVGEGVYAGWVLVEGKIKAAVINVGKRPTFGEMPKAIEVHIFNFNKKIYGKKIKVFFVKKLREEKKFKHEDELIQQIKKDAETAEKILKKANKPLVFS